MNELKDKLQELKKRFDSALALVNLEDQKKQLAKLQTEMSQPNFWADQNKAKSVGQEASGIETEIQIWEKFQTDLSDTLELLELDSRDRTVNLHDDIATHYEELLKQFATLERNLLFSAKYDTKSAIMMINAGSGGTDAQDWAEMLLRMYLRFCEKQGWKTSITSISEGQEAGIKSVQFEVEGRYAYGHLKGEHGVHRLVRISPFDAEKMRHTSFAMVEVLPLLDNEVNIEIKPEELRIDTYRAGGHGGQSVNTTDSAVRITHLPTGITVQCQNERSQLQNKDKALSHLKSKLQRYYETEIEEERQRLRGEYTEAAWGNQARSYVLHPYKLVKDHRTDFESTETVKILDGDIIEFVEAYLRKSVSS